MPALVFDCDGVLADTERDGHRVAFNQTFRELGLPLEWSVEVYAEKLQVAGGKERMATELTPEFAAANGLPADPDGQAELLAGWHKRKTAIYTEMVAAGPPSAAAGDRPRHRGGGTPPAGRWPSPRRRRSRRCAPSSSRRPGPSARPRFARPRRRRGGAQEAGAGHLPARPRAPRDVARRDARHRGLAQRAARRGRRGPALRHDRQRLHRGGGCLARRCWSSRRWATRTASGRASSPTASAARPGDYVTLADLERCLAG